MGSGLMAGRRKRRKKGIVIIAAVILCAALVSAGITAYGKYQMGRIPGLTFAEALAYTTKDNADAVITVGTIQNGDASYRVYGENGRELPAELHTYEIGSITKTVTAGLIGKAIAEGKISIEDTIETYLPLPDGNAYPTIRELLTHTSGYKGYYFEPPMVSNFLTGSNDFLGITKEMVLDRARSLSMDRERYGFAYSNYGYAVLGLVLESVYGTDYASLADGFLQNTLGLTGTKISDQSGDLGNYWDWAANDAYLPAGAVTSNISDMLSYARMQLDDDPYFSQCHKSLQTIDASTKEYQAMGIEMDEIGMAWIIDRRHGVIWHNGGTGNYNSYMGFHPETKTAVVVLSNLAPSERIPATVLGVKLLMELENQVQK